MDQPAYETQLQRLITDNECVMAILRTVCRCNPPDWLVGAGVIRNLVWVSLYQPTFFR